MAMLPRYQCQMIIPGERQQNLENSMEIGTCEMTFVFR